MDAFKTTLSIKGSQDFPRVVGLTNTVFGSSSFGGKSILDLPKRSSAARHYFQIAGNGPILSMWATKSGGVVLNVSNETVEKAMGDLKSDSMIKGLLMMGRMKKLNAACAILPQVCEAIRVAVLHEDPGARIEISDRIAEFV